MINKRMFNNTPAQILHHLLYKQPKPGSIENANSFQAREIRLLGLMKLQNGQPLFYILKSIQNMFTLFKMKNKAK